MRRLIIIAAFAASYAAAEEPPQADDTEKSYPRLETIPITVYQANKRCEREKCEPVYRIPEEQLDRLKALDQASPGEIIQLAPDRPRKTRGTPRR